MKDDWNIYVHHIHFYDDYYVIGNPPVKAHPEYYKGKDIEILRKKLIEDFDELEKELETYYGIKKGEIYFKKIINKRFGVKE